MRNQEFRSYNTTALRNEWLQTLDKIGALDPHTVVAGHKRPGTVDGTFNIQTTREYIDNFKRVVNESTDKEEVQMKILGLYRNRNDPRALVVAGAAATLR